MIRQGRAKYAVQEVCLHTTATPEKWWRGKTAAQMMAEVREWHKKRGWKREGYHGLFAPDGSFEAGRPYTMIGAGVKERNRGVIHFVMVPSRTHNGVKTFNSYFTSAQRRAVKRKIAEIDGIKWVTGHNEYSNKECPGFYVVDSEWLPQPKRIPFWQRLWARKRGAMA